MKKKILYVLFLIVTILAALSPFYLFGGFLGDFGDPIGQTIPNKFLLLQYFKNGIMPFWNPFSFLGFPILSDIQVGTFYFPDWIIFGFFSPLQAHNVSVLFHLIFAAVGVFFLTEKLSKSRELGVVLGLTMALTGVLLTKIVYLNFLETISFVPWILFFVTSKKNIILKTSLLTALMIFAGHPVAVFYSMIIVFVFTVFNYTKSFFKVLVGIFCGLMISAIQVIPFIYLKSLSIRDSLSYSQFTEGSMGLASFKTLFLPFAEGLSNAFDSYLYFGTISLVAMFVGLIFVRKMNTGARNLYLTGIGLFLFGFLLSLGGTLPFLTKILYHLPFFNIVRVPLRYSIVMDFGAIFCLIAFFGHVYFHYKKTAIIFLLLIFANVVITPYFFLPNGLVSDAEKQYDIGLNEQGSLFEQPQYFLSSSFFLFPNRHVLSFIPNVIGYNPMVLKSFYNSFPVSPVGSFKDPDYFTKYYDDLISVGLKYYIFPSEKFLAKKGLFAKKSVIDFLKSKNWESKEISGGDAVLWQNPAAKPFAYFLNEDNKIISTNFSPGKIKMDVDVQKDDTLVLNQEFIPGWKMSVSGEAESFPGAFNELVQAYSAPKGRRELIFVYTPQGLLLGALVSVFGLMAVIILSVKFRNKI